MLNAYTTDTRAALYLAADPALQRQAVAGGEAAIAAYLETSDIEHLAAFDLSTVSKVELKPLSDADVERIDREVGEPPQLGERISAEVAGGRKTFDLDGAERAALREFNEWAKKRRRAVIKSALISLDGEKGAFAWATVESIHARGLRDAVESELWIHAMRLTNLGFLGKSPSSPESGEPIRAAGASGTATNAEDVVGY